MYNEGLTLYSKDNHLVALKQLQQAEQIAIGQTDSNFLSYINTMIGRSYQQLGLFDNAIQQFQDSIENSFEAKQYYNVIQRISHCTSTTRNISQANNDQAKELMARLALGALIKLKTVKKIQ